MINDLIENEKCEGCYWWDKCGGDDGEETCNDFTPVDEYGENCMDDIIEQNRKDWYACIKRLSDFEDASFWERAHRKLYFGGLRVI